MAIPNINFKTYLTSGNAVGSDGGAAQNDPDTSLGGWRSTTQVSSTLGNLFETYSSAELLASTRYRCVALVMDLPAESEVAARIIATQLASLKAGISVEFGIMTRDSLSVAPVCTDTVAPAGITFFSPVDSTGDNNLDYTTARPLGPLNTDSDGATDLDLDDSVVVFLYIKVISVGATGAFTDGVDNVIGTRTIGIDSV